MTKGRRGKLVASCSLEWNSSMVRVEFWSKEKTHECMWKALSDITYWKPSNILASERIFYIIYLFIFNKKQPKERLKTRTHNSS